MKNDSDIKNTKETLQFDIAFSEAEGMDSTVATLSFFPEMEEQFKGIINYIKNEI